MWKEYTINYEKGTFARYRRSGFYWILATHEGALLAFNSEQELINYVEKLA